MELCEVAEGDLGRALDSDTLRPLKSSEKDVSDDLLRCALSGLEPPASISSCVGPGYAILEFGDVDADENRDALCEADRIKRVVAVSGWGSVIDGILSVCCMRNV